MAEPHTVAPHTGSHREPRTGLAASLAKLRVIVAREYVERVRTRWFVFTTLFGPLFFIGVTLLPASLAARRAATPAMGMPRAFPPPGAHAAAPAHMVLGFVIAFLLYMMILLYGQNVLRSVLEEKTSRVAEIILASVKPDLLLAGKVIGVGAVGLTQQLFWLASAAALATQSAAIARAVGLPELQGATMPHIPLPILGALVLGFLLGYVLYSSLFAAAGAMVGSQEEAQQAAQPLTLMLVVSMVFVQPILLHPDGALATALTLFPFTAPIILPFRLSATTVPPLEIAGSLVLVALTCWGAIWVSARIYRVGLLMTGKRPNLRELVRWIRYS